MEKQRGLPKAKPGPPPPTTSLSRKARLLIAGKEGVYQASAREAKSMSACRALRKGHVALTPPLCDPDLSCLTVQGPPLSRPDWKRANLDSERGQGLQRNKEGGLPLVGCRSLQTPIQDAW